MYYSKLKTIYIKKISKICMQEFNIKNAMAVPKVVSINLSMGLGDAVNNPSVIDTVKRSLELISGQTVTITKAKKSISSFKVRQGMQIGLKVTLRRNQMWNFLYKFANIALPRVRDFQGIFNRFDGCGNITIGIKDSIIFPELDYKDIDKVRGMNVTIKVKAANDSQAKFLLRYLGIPII